LYVPGDKGHILARECSLPKAFRRDGAGTIRSFRNRQSKTSRKEVNMKKSSTFRPFRAIAVAAAIAISSSGALAQGRSADVDQPFPLGVGILAPVQFPNPEVGVFGFRLNLGYAQNAGMMGLDIGVFVNQVDNELFGLEISGMINSIGFSSGAFQIAGLANICYGDFYGAQLSGIANMAGGRLGGGQIGCFNNADEMSGLQIGLYNRAASSGSGFQIGVVNYAGSFRGVQIGLVNIIEDNRIPFLPIFNASF
jgi:hypothetical protein